MSEAGRAASPELFEARGWIGLAVVALALGAWLRCDQFTMQVLIDDEWHAVHQLLRLASTPMWLDFGHADFSIPLGLLYALESRTIGLSETAMRWPMLVSGVATLVLFPLYVAPRLGRAPAAVFALLLALSPLLVIYSRMARPYAITLLLAWSAHAAFHRFDAGPRSQIAAGATYAIAAALAAWLHPIIAPFLVAPFLWAGFDLVRGPSELRGPRFRRLFALAVATGVPMAALLVPPLLAHPESLVAKAGIDRPGFDTLVGAWYAWLGTPSTFAVFACCALAIVGAGAVWRAVPIARSGMVGILLTLAVVMATGVAWSHNPLTLARYLLPFAPLLLLSAATGAVRISRRIAAPGQRERKVAAVFVALAPAAALAIDTPLTDIARHPNAQTIHLVYHVDFRPERNPYLPYMAKIPLSPFWARLAGEPRGSLRVAAAPFYFESYDWDAPRWERTSGQTVIPGYLTGLCVDARAGEVPQSSAFRFANAVHLADTTALAAHHIDYVVWQKPFVQTGRGRPEPIGRDTAHCEAALRARFGTPSYEDDALVAFRLPPAGSN